MAAPYAVGWALVGITGRDHGFFVIREKGEDHYSPSTMYGDDVIAPDLFHKE